MADLNKREIAVNQLLMASHCLHSVLAPSEAHKRAREARCDNEDRASVLGDAVHKFMRGMNEASVVNDLQERIAELPEEEREKVVQLAAAIAVKKKSNLKSGDNVRVERLQSWLDSETNWTIFSQPDRVEILADEHGEYIQVLDWKMTKYIRRRHKEAARLFGLIQFMRGKGRMRIKLVIECLVDASCNWSEWFSTSDALELLREVQETLTRLDESMKCDAHAPRTTGPHCHGCKIKEACKQGGKWIARNSEVRTSARRVPVLQAA